MKQKISPDTPIGELELSVREYNCLYNIGCKTIGEITTYSDAALLRSPNFGIKSLKALKEILWTYGYALKTEPTVTKPEDTVEGEALLIQFLEAENAWRTFKCKFYGNSRPRMRRARRARH